MKVYIASSLHNAERVRNFKTLFEMRGVEVTYDWTRHGQVFTTEELRKYAIGERDGVVDCDLLFFVHPARMGAHVELGIALALAKPVVILEEEPVEQKTFYHLDNVWKFTKEDEAFDFAIKKLTGIA